MSEIVNCWWFSTTDETIGIVKVYDNITQEEKFYIGVADGIDEAVDMENIRKFGANLSRQ